MSSAENGRDFSWIKQINVWCDNMKKILPWFLRICCFAVIGVAAFTLIRCILHVNDDHSAAAVLGTTATPAVFDNTQGTASSTLEISADSDVEENPTVILSADGSATVNHSKVRITASFSNIINSIQADLKWYLDGELVSESNDQLLVEGSTAIYGVTVDVENAEAAEAQVELEVSFDDKTVSANTAFPVEQPDDGKYIMIQTEEITVTCIQDCSIYSDSGLSENTGEIMYEEETGLLLAYDTNSSGLSALKLQFPDGSEGWVSARRNEITDEDCTTDEDYTDEQKMDFVNSMNYDSETQYLVWVSLYTQKVNVFTGYKGNWTLVQTFDCATGINETPTTTGVFKIQTLKERWDLGITYVEPVLIFNGGEAFTSQPYDVETDEIVDDTMGEPASGGSVRMLEEDIAWMSENMTIDTMVVVY